MKSKPWSTKSGLNMAFKKLKLYAEMVMFSHTLFSLPVTLAAMLMAAHGFPGWKTFIWIVLAFTGGRNAANAMNRIVDRNIDARNPRTAGRHLPSGKLHRRDALAVAVAGMILLTVSAFMLNWLCVVLLPLAAGIFILYSYTKRFTWLCHIILGAACAGGAFGAWVGVTAGAELTTFVLAAANAAWVAGFDVIYAIQDIDFDRSEGLYSIPSVFGEKLARLGAAGMHAASVLLMAVTGYLQGLGIIYYAGVGIITALFIFEHLLILPERVKKDSRLINFAAYNINQIIGVTFLLFTALALFF